MKKHILVVDDEPAIRYPIIFVLSKTGHKVSEARDLKNLEFHILDTGHFALEEDGDFIARLIREFVEKNVAAPKAA
jgi:DNA-binding response OmpR family regulator